MSTKVLVLGGTGFIGFNIIKHLSEKKNCVLHIVDNLSRGKFDCEFRSFLKQHPALKFIKGDLTDPRTFSRLDNNYDYIYHLAAIVGVSNVLDNPARVLYVNTVSTLNLLEWLKDNKKKLKRLLFTSTSEVYAETLKLRPDLIPTSESIDLTVEPTYPGRSSYAISKILGESAGLTYARKYVFPVTIVRFHNIYGPRMGYSHVIPELLLKADREKKYLGVYSMNHTRAFCYIDDAVEAIMKLMANKKTINKIIHIGNDQEEVTIGRLAEYIVNLVNPRLTIKRLGEHEGSPRRRYPDISYLKEITGFIPKIALKEGLQKTWDWYKNHLEQ